MYISSGSKGSELLEKEITIYVYGAPNETIYFSGNTNESMKLNASGYGEKVIMSGYWTLTGSGDGMKIYPNGLSLRLAEDNNTIYLRKPSTVYWYNFISGPSWKFYDQDSKTTAYGNKWKPTGSDSSGWSIMVHSNGHIEFWCRCVPDEPFSILKEDGTKYKKCKIMASGYCHTYPELHQGANEYDWYHPYCRSYVGVIDPSTGNSLGDHQVNGTKVVTTIDISSISGNTILPYIKSEEKGDTTGQSPGNMNPTTTVYVVWFE
jgi:hypothetical protein